MVNRLLAGTFFLHLRGWGEEELLACAEDCCPHKVSSRTLGPAFFLVFTYLAASGLSGSKWELPLWCKDAPTVAQGLSCSQA